MMKNDIYKAELEKLKEIFEDVNPSKAKLVEGLIDAAAFLKAENSVLKLIIKKNGMVKIHPDDPSRQKQTEVAKQYLKNVNSYATVIKTLNGVLMKNTIEESDDFDEFIQEMKNKD